MSILKFDDVENILNELVNDYLSDLEGFIDEDGNVNWGDNKLGYKNKVELIEDLLLYIKK